MTRRAIKKLMRRAEEALSEERYRDAEVIYSSMLHEFRRETPSLLDHAACLFMLIQTLHAQGQTEQAIELSDRAPEIIAERAPLAVAA